MLSNLATNRGGGDGVGGTGGVCVGETRAHSQAGRQGQEVPQVHKLQGLCYANGTASIPVISLHSSHQPDSFRPFRESAGPTELHRRAQTRHDWPQLGVDQTLIWRRSGTGLVWYRTLRLWQNQSHATISCCPGWSAQIVTYSLFNASNLVTSVT